MTIENIIDDDRRQNTFGLMMSLNMLIENGDAFDYTPSDFDRWTKAAGFKKTEIIPLTSPSAPRWHINKNLRLSTYMNFGMNHIVI